MITTAQVAHGLPANPGSVSAYRSVVAAKTRSPPPLTTELTTVHNWSSFLTVIPVPKDRYSHRPTKAVQ